MEKQKKILLRGLRTILPIDSGKKSDFSPGSLSTTGATFTSLGASALLLTLFTLLTNQVSRHKTITLDQTFESWLSDKASPRLDKYFKGFTLLGKEPVTLTLSAGAFGFLLRRKQPLAASLVLISTWGGWLLSRPVKVLVRRPRPLSINTLAHHPDAKSYPSGHSMVAVCFYGMLIWLGFKLFKRPLGRIGWAVLLIYLILMIGLSRAYLKEHHPSDVLGGYLLGSFWLAVVICSANIYQPGHEVTL